MMGIINKLLKVFGIVILPRKRALHSLAVDYALIKVQIDALSHLTDLISIKELKKQVQVYEEDLLKA
ncbi:MAG: hypothetical protein HPY53_01670 [Brevinematales bacterium]|nr:hypothetical protein [Brevinematales bacterium]